MNSSPSKKFLNIAFVRQISPKLSGGFADTNVCSDIHIQEDQVYPLFHFQMPLFLSTSTINVHCGYHNRG